MVEGLCAGASGAGLGSSDMFVPPRPIRMSAREKTVMRSSPSNAMARWEKSQKMESFNFSWRPLGLSVDSIPGISAVSEVEVFLYGYCTPENTLPLGLVFDFGHWTIH